MQSVGSVARPNNTKLLLQQQGRNNRALGGKAAAATTAATFGINFYNDTPNIELDLDTFEIYALKRLKVLRKLEQFKTSKLSRDELRIKVKQVMDEEDLIGGTILDETSHFILRLSYCQTEHLRRWFLLHECDLLKIRLQLLSHEQLGKLVESYLGIKPIDNERKEELRPQLLLQSSVTGLQTSNNSSGFLISASEFQRTQFFSVPFTKALDLIAKRECYLEGGQAYISQNKVEAILVGQFRAQLSRQLSTLQQDVSLDTSLQHDPEGSRVYPLLKNLSRCLVHKEQTSVTDYTMNGGAALSASTVGSHVSSMPLCMREMHNGMKKQGKLKFFGRLQYGLFLKGAGLDLDNALAFFQRHFTKVTGEQFQKEYSYNIRYQYGKEGKRKSHDPYSCAAIIHGNAPSTSGDYYGCPFKHYDVDSLASSLQGLSMQDKNEVLALKKEGHFNLACHKHFIVQHPRALELSSEVPLDNIGNHPNAWFRASLAYKAATSSATMTTESPPKAANQEAKPAATVSPMV
ncbi:hypothetical protein ACA910_019971 [Epithemia clementina (nom. ined.)]